MVETIEDIWKDVIPIARGEPRHLVHAAQTEGADSHASTRQAQRSSRPGNHQSSCHVIGTANRLVGQLDLQESLVDPKTGG